MLPAVLPLFPLSQVALFPHTFLPLHIFEPRYRQLVTEALVGHQHFILVLAKDPVTTDPLDRPAIFEVGCLARIVRAEPLSEGRWNILVEGPFTIMHTIAIANMKWIMKIIPFRL